MTRIVKSMLPIAALFAVFLFVDAAHAATEPPDPCSLRTPAQVSGVMRATYAAPVKSVAPRTIANSGPGTDCRYNGRKPLWFRIYYDGSANDATTLFAKRKVFRSPKTAASGIGDEAYFDRGGALHARKGNARFYLDVGTDRQEPAVTKLGEIVAGQL
jgi:hypothetical protein